MTNDHNTPARGIAGRFAKMLPAAGGLLSLLSAAPAAAQGVEAGRAPAAWLAYAQAVSVAVQARLDSDDPAALRLRAYLQQLPDAGDAKGALLKVAFWIDRSGRITRIEHALFAQPAPNEDLQSLIVGQVVAEAPPKDMLLPIRVTLHIAPKPQDGSGAEPAPAAMTISLRYRIPAKPPYSS